MKKFIASLLVIVTLCGIGFYAGYMAKLLEDGSDESYNETYDYAYNTIHNALEMQWLEEGDF